MRRKRFASIFLLIIIIAMSSIQVRTEAAQRREGSRTVRIACGMNDSLYLDDKGNPTGIALSFVRQLAWNNNWNVEYVEGSYTESLQNLYDDKVDIMFPVGLDDNTDGKLAYAEFIGGYQQIGLFAREDDDIFYEDYEAFNNKKVGISIGSNSELLDNYSAEKGFSYTPVSLNSIQDKIDALNNGDVDMIAFSTLNHVPGGKLVAVIDQVPIYFCTTTDKKDLLDEINSGISQAMINTPDIVADLYQGILEGANPVSFTSEEHDKIINTDQITFGVYSDCLPLAGINSDGECVGIYVDILKEIANESGLDIEIIPVKDSNRLYSYMDDGTVDYVIGIQELRFYSENADNYLASNGITDYTTVAVSKPDFKFDEANKPKIALTKSRNYLEEYIYSNYPDAEIQYFNSRKECLNAVQNGSFDATFINTWEYNYEKKNPRFSNLMEWESMRVNSVIGLGATRQSDLEILSILEKTISQIPKDKITDIIAANINMPYATYSFKDRLYQYKNEIIIVVTVILVVGICLTIYLNVRRKYVKDLIIANRTKSDFLSRMSHELRTPLNAINGYAAITKHNAETGCLDNKVLSKDMKSIHNASEYLLSIINDILDVQKMETGRLVLNPIEINPTEYMETVVNMIRPMAEDKKVDFIYEMVSGKEYNYILDGFRVQQILFNLLWNAVKFTPKGGTVTLKSELTEIKDDIAVIQFSIADTGIGMSQDFINNKLFHKFAQENQNITSPYSGCGNGLAICKELVDLMEGSISCISEQGKGTIFTVIIKAEYKKPEHRRRTRAAVNYDLSGIRVLMCEDNKMNQDMEKKILEKMHCEVDIADDGQIGLQKFADSVPGSYDIILMDIRMPNMDGLEATRAIRKLEREDSKKIPILAVSANAFEEDVNKSLAAGMNEHLSKPVNARLLYEKIKQYTEIK